MDGLDVLTAELLEEIASEKLNGGDTGKAVRPKEATEILEKLGIRDAVYCVKGGVFAGSLWTFSYDSACGYSEGPAARDEYHHAPIFILEPWGGPEKNEWTFRQITW